jgi:hypothetical protein
MIKMLRSWRAVAGFGLVGALATGIDSRGDAIVVWGKWGGNGPVGVYASIETRSTSSNR